MTFKNFVFYFVPEYVENFFVLYGGYANFISAYALYVAICDVFCAIMWFCAYKYTSDKLMQFKEYYKKSSPETMRYLVQFAKDYNNILSEISAASSVSEFEALKTKVDEYNYKAEAFAEEHGVTPKLITASDYDLKRESF